MRLLPNDAVQAAASLLALTMSHCAWVALAYDPSGVSLAELIKARAALYGVTIVAPTLLVRSPPNVERFAAAVRAAGADCVEIAGAASPLTVPLATRVREVAPAVHLFLGSDGMCRAAWTNPLDGGVTPLLDRLLMCTRPTLPIDSYPGGRAFRTEYARAFGGVTPDAYALLGYTAMQLGLEAIASAGRSGDNRGAVLRALLYRIHHTRLGIFMFNRFGDSTLDQYGLYKVGVDGNPVYAATLRPRFGF
jgi:hypothetical protein